MTSSVIRKYVLAALCGAAIVGVGQTAQAATWDITGGVLNFAPPNYGFCPNQNNVLNQGVLGNAHVFDELNGATYLRWVTTTDDIHYRIRCDVDLCWLRIRQYP